MMTSSGFIKRILFLICGLCLVGLWSPGSLYAQDFEVDWSAIHFPRPHVKVDLRKFPGWDTKLRPLQDAAAQLAIRYANAYAEEFCPQIGLPKDCDLFVKSRQQVVRYVFTIQDRKLFGKVNKDIFDTSVAVPIAQSNVLDAIARGYLLDRLDRVPQLESAKQKAWQQKYFAVVKRSDEVAGRVDQLKWEDSALDNMASLESLKALTSRNYLWVGVSILLGLLSMAVVRRGK